MAELALIGKDDPCPWQGLSRAVVIVAHPDDAEYYCGGLLQRLREWDVVISYLVASNGERGLPADTAPEMFARIRQDEQRTAAGRAGVTDVRFLDLPDGELRAAKLIEPYVATIREVRPQLLVTHDFLTRLYRQHPDHRAVGEAALEAAFPASRLATYFPAHASEGLTTWTVSHALLVASDIPDCVIELTQTALDQKLAALADHQSQEESFAGGARARVTFRAQQASARTSFAMGEAFKYVDLS